MATNIWVNIGSGNFLNQCWLTIPGVPWHSPESNFTSNAHDVDRNVHLNIVLLESLKHLPGDNELTHCKLMMHICVSRQIITGTNADTYKQLVIHREKVEWNLNRHRKIYRKCIWNVTYGMSVILFFLSCFSLFMRIEGPFVINFIVVIKWKYF